MNSTLYLPNTASTAAQQKATVGVAAATLLSLLGTPLHAKTDMVQIAVETDAVRICPTGTVPTSTLGTLVYPGQVFELSRQEADVAQVIRVTTNATLQVAQFSRK